MAKGAHVVAKQSPNVSVSITSERISVDSFKAVVPKHIKPAITEELIDQVYEYLDNPVLAQEVANNVLGYIQVLQEGKFKIEDYVYAAKFVSFKLMGNSNFDSYVKVFPDRYQALLAKGADRNKIGCYVAAYNKNKLVNLILEQTLIPTHILNADLYQRAINVQAELMIGAKSEKVRSDAANSLLQHLKAPETAKIELSVKTEQTSVMEELKNAAAELVQQQRKALELGTTNANELAKQKLITDKEEDIIDAEYVERS